MKKIFLIVAILFANVILTAQTITPITYIKLSSLPSSSLLNSTIFPVQDSSVAGYVNKKLSLSNLSNNLLSPLDINDWSFYNDTLRYNGYAKFNNYTSISTLTVPGTASVTETGLANSAVTPVKTSFMVVGKNKFNVNDPNILNGYYLWGDGTPHANSSYTVTGYIPIIQGQTLYSNYSGISGLLNCQYDAGKNFISGTNFTTAAATGVSGAAYVRFTLNIPSAGSLSAVQIENGTSGSSYQPYTDLYNKVITPAIQDTNITYSKTKFFTLGKNLFNYATVTKSAFIDWGNGSVDGGFPAGDASDFISVTAGLTYMCNTTIPYRAFYDSNQVFVSGNSSGSYPVTIPAGCRYIRITVDTAHLSVCQFELGTASSNFAPYTYILQDLDGVAPITVANNSITPAQLSNVLLPSKNLFNMAAAAYKTYIDWTDGNVNGYSYYPSAYASDFIPVTAGAVYSCNTAILYKAFYNSNYVFVSGSMAGTYPVTIPAGCSYIRITADSANLANIQFEAGQYQTSYFPYGYTSKWQYVNPTPPTLQWASDGDSITREGYWQPAVAKALNIINTNLGIPGTRVSLMGGSDSMGMCSNYRVGRIPSNSNIITLLGGTNDWAGNAALGDTSSMDSTTFCGALNVWIKKVTTAFPTARIFLLTTTYGEMSGEAGTWTNTYTNLIGLTTRDYANAVILAGKRNSIPVIDLNNDCGWNTYNIGTFLQDGIHPNALGAARMANVIIKKIQGLLP
jgi:hypothetical protein